MLAARLAAHDDVPTDDPIILLRGAAWSDYQRLIEMRSEGRFPKISYLEGTLELMVPIDLAQLVTFIDRPTTSQAMREYRAALQR